MKTNKIKNIKFAAIVALGSAIGTGIYQLLTQPEITFDVYRPIFVGVFTFAIAATWLAIMPQKNN